MYRVLIADDEQLMREAMEIMVSRVDGFQVARSVCSGNQAVEACRSGEIDLAFLDIMMPGISGIEACKKIYRDSPETAVYIVSAYKTFEFAREALKMEVKEYLTKPVSCRTVENLLKSYAQGNRMYSQVLDELYAMLKEKNYRRMYYKIPKMIEEAGTFCGNRPNCMKNIFQRVLQNLAAGFGWPDEQQAEYGKIFSKPEFTFSPKRSLQFWLFEMMDDAFQKLCIEKYPVTESAFQYINQNIEREIGLNEIVKHCNISQGYLSRIFMQQMHVSVLEYIHMKKLMIAKKYFSFTGLSVAEVAYRLGYNESSYFSKVFKKYENVTVFQYRKASENGTETARSGEE